MHMNRKTIYHRFRISSLLIPSVFFFFIFSTTLHGRNCFPDICFPKDSLLKKTCKALKDSIRLDMQQMEQDDRFYRGGLMKKIHDKPKKYKNISLDSLMGLQAKLDSINLYKVLSLINRCDCLNKDSVGKDANLIAIFFVFLHNPHKMHIPWINNIIKKEISDGYLKADGFTAAYDRYLFLQNKPVLYGAYGGIKPCIVDFEKTNAARKELRLAPLAKEDFNDCLKK